MFPENQERIRCIDLTVGVKLFQKLDSKTSNMFVDYIVKDGERPDILADRVYGNPLLHWVLLITNKIVNPFFEWPLSSMELEDHIDNTYAGQALFFDCRKNGIRFNYPGSSTKFSAAKSNFVVGQTVTQDEATATVTGWDPTLRKLVINDVSGTFNTEAVLFSNNQDGDEFGVIPSLIVLENKHAPHHFEDDLGNVMDPYGFVNPNYYTDGKIYSPDSYILYNNGVTDPTDTNNFPLNRYINGGVSANVITNSVYEQRTNDLKRQIKVLRVEHVDAVAQQLSVAFV
jgi:hypothetical protein